jgi:hypothetical protein
MSFRPNSLAFEFHACAPEQLRECLSVPAFDAPCSLNIILGYSWQFVWADWKDKQAVLDYAAKLTAHLFGDVYVKFGE